MALNQNENILEKSGCSYLEDSRLLYPDTFNQIPNVDIHNFQNQLENYSTQLNQPTNYNKTYHFQYTGKLEEFNTTPEKQNSNNNKDNKNKISKSPLKDLSNSIIIKKDNKFLTNSSYVGFVNEYGDNSCYVNVVLHLLNNINDVNNILKDISKIEKMKKESLSLYENLLNNCNPLNDNIITKEEFLSNIGEILNVYDLIMKLKNKEKNVTLLNTFKFRQNLDKFSKRVFKFNSIADPVELLLLILDNLNSNYKQQIHNNFYLNIIDQTNCPKRCKNSMKVRFDKDNFCYHIYVNELLDFIKDEAKRFKETKENLFELTLDLYKNEIKICEKCTVLYEKYLICYTIPRYLLINCVWSTQPPEQKIILDFLFLLCVKEDLNRLFICDNTKEKTEYNLLGIVLYSYSLSHYTIILYNKKEKVFVLHNDNIIIEYKTLYDCFSQILIDNIELYDNNKAYFCPILLLYTKEKLYNEDDIKLNELNEFKYVEMLNKIEECQNKYLKRHYFK